ncbi:MAG: aminotransferase class V-fold PLP-dependent enzyme [Candidatus Kapaibacteriota bacterium]
MSSRRKFLGNAIGSVGALSLVNFNLLGDTTKIDEIFDNSKLKSDNSIYLRLVEESKKFLALPDEEAAKDNDFWRLVKESYIINSKVLNLNNGGVCPQPKIVIDTLNNYNLLCNDIPTINMWRKLDKQREPLRNMLADLAGVSPKEIAINRNATEGLNSIIFGLNLKEGDEVILTKQDYPNMIHAWRQREKRDKIKLIWLDLEMPSNDENYFVSQYVNAMTEKTKIVQINQMINWNGQILPVQKIAREAHKRKIEVLVDAAHSFAQLDFKIPDLECDYFATSLHKWMCAPFGTGMMYIKENKIKNVWALLSADDPDGVEIKKFEHLGTRSFAVEMATIEAINFHNLITTKRKQQRLNYLSKYWTDKCLDIPKFKLNTVIDPKFSCGVVNFGYEDLDPTEVDKFLFDTCDIHAVTIKVENIKGVRITPNVYTLASDLDRLVDGLHKFDKKQIKKQSKKR